MARGRKPTLITIDNTTRSLGEWAEIAHLPCSTLRSRLLHGWPAEQLLLRHEHVASNRRVRAPSTVVTLAGRTQTAKEWMKELNLTYGAVRYRMATAGKTLQNVLKDALTPPTETQPCISHSISRSIKPENTK